MSRRNFLSKGTATAIAAGSSIVAIQAIAPQTTQAAGTCTTGDAVYTECEQTLLNKTIPSWVNTLGADAQNVKEFGVSGNDITDALNAAISFLNSGGYGGKILIPHNTNSSVRVWTSNGGHEMKSGISIEGVGWTSAGSLMGTEIVMNSGSSNSFMFRISAPTMNCSINDLTINLSDKPTATGLVLTDHHNGSIQGDNIYNTTVKNVQFTGGAYGIRVDSKETSGASTHFECILNRFERVFFYGCTTSFACNTGNGGYVFDTCRFFIPPFYNGHTVYGTCLDCKWIGYAEFSNCLFTQNPHSWGSWDDKEIDYAGSAVLRTFGAYGSIYFHNCQDENIRYFYHNSTNDYFDGAFVVQNSLLQGSFRFTADGSATIDNCQINANTDVFRIIDGEDAAARIYLKGLNRLFTNSNINADPATIAPFVNKYSQLLTESHEFFPVTAPVSGSDGSGNYIELNGTIGVITVASGTSSIRVKNKMVGPVSHVFATFRENPGSAAVKYVTYALHEFTIHLTQTVSSDTDIGFKVIQ